MHQLLTRDGAEGLSDGSATGRTVACTTQEVHLNGAVVLLFQVVAHFSKLRQLKPAGLSGAAAGHTVAFTRSLHGPFHSLVEEKIVN